jgi:hypothetical protein
MKWRVGIPPAARTAGFGQFRRFWREINILDTVPESRFSGRYGHDESIPRSSVDDGGGGSARGRLRLQVLWSLPQPHQRYVFEKIRNLCRDYLRKRRIPPSELTPEELLSEIWQKMLGTVSLDNDEAQRVTPSPPAEWSVSPSPEQDGRVVWLINEIGGAGAIGHRYEDIKRERWGKPIPGRGRRIVQPEDGEPLEGVDQNWDEGRSLREADSRMIWSGMLAMSTREFRSTEDVAKLLQLLARFPDLFDASSGSQWPVRGIVALLNVYFPPPEWRDRRVEDARKRLTNWIKRLTRENALDATDLEALFARIGRQLEEEKGTVRSEARALKLQS